MSDRKSAAASAWRSQNANGLHHSQKKHAPPLGKQQEALLSVFSPPPPDSPITVGKRESSAPFGKAG